MDWSVTGAESVLFDGTSGLDRRSYILSQTLRLIRLLGCVEEVRSSAASAAMTRPCGR